jgi:hypothetical protein
MRLNFSFITLKIRSINTKIYDQKLFKTKVEQQLQLLLSSFFNAAAYYKSTIILF